MKGFQKLALASAVAALPATGVAMEPLNDTEMSGVTGQDGIVIGLQTDVVAGVELHDTDGLDGVAGDDAGAIMLDGFGITRNDPADEITITIDADGGGSAPFLNINVDTPDDLTVSLGEVGVAKSAGGRVTDDWSTTDTVANVMNLGEMTLGATDLNIQLGNEPQGDMIAIDTEITGGISIDGFSLNDAVDGGSLAMDLTVVDAGGANLTVDTGINLDDTDGLVMGLDGVGAAGEIDVTMAGLSLGTTDPIGDVRITGLDLTGDVVVRGK